MKKKSAVLYSLPFPVLTEGCDLVIRAGELLRKPKTNEIFCHFDIIGLQDCSLSSVTLTLSFYNGQKKLLGDSQYVFTEISLLRGQSIGEKDEVPVPYKAARSFTVRISSITDKSGKELLFSEDDVIILSGRRLLEDALGDPELAVLTADISVRSRPGSGSVYAAASIKAPTAAAQYAIVPGKL